VDPSRSIQPKRRVMRRVGRMMMRVAMMIAVVIAIATDHEVPAIEEAKV
jgi:hypothetical protein